MDIECAKIALRAYQKYKNPRYKDFFDFFTSQVAISKNKLSTL